MKKSEKKEPVNPIPEGVWESTRPVSGSRKSSTADLQGNGYPETKGNRK